MFTNAFWACEPGRSRRAWTRKGAMPPPLVTRQRRHRWLETTYYLHYYHVCRLIVFTTRFNVVIKSISALWLVTQRYAYLSLIPYCVCEWGDNYDDCSLYLPLYLLFPALLNIISSPLLDHFAFAHIAWNLSTPSVQPPLLHRSF